MSLRVSSAAHTIAPVAPVSRVRARSVETAWRDASLPTGSEGTSQWSQDLRRQRSEALAELRDVAAPTSGTNHLRRLDREQLAAMVYDREDRFSVDLRRGAFDQMEANDREFLERARDMARVSGDDRVLHAALIDLENAKSPIERATPEGAPVPDLAGLRRDIAVRTAELDGAPVSLSLHYPNGFAAPTNQAVSAASPGATRITQLYRDALF